MRVLVAGVGNVFLGDDGFGVEVARKLLALDWPEDVRVVELGTRGFDLAFALADADAAVLVDTLRADEPPGTLVVVDLDDAPRGAPPVLLETHGMTPDRVLAALGKQRPRTLIVGCVPHDFGGEDGRVGLSPVVRAVVDDAVVLVQRTVERVRHA